jgi:hypothetical protein
VPAGVDSDLGWGEQMALQLQATLVGRKPNVAQSNLNNNIVISVAATVMC